MNTPTPRERFRKTLHISTGVSELLADSNASYIHWLEKELAAVTEKRNEWKAKFIQQNKDLGCEMMDPNGTIWDHAKKLQTELATVTEQLTAAREELAIYKANNPKGYAAANRAREELAAVTEQRDRLDVQLDQIILRLGKTQEKMFNAEKQRDRLAEALEQIASTDPNWRDCILIAKEALQSLNPDHTVAANDMIAAVKGGADE